MRDNDRTEAKQTANAEPKALVAQEGSTALAAHDGSTPLAAHDGSTPLVVQGSDLSLAAPILDRYASTPGSLITILQELQDVYGYLPEDVLYHVADRLGISPAHVLGVATFYAQFRLTPMGRHLVMVCKGTACHVNGSDRISATVEEYLGISGGQTTADGMFTLENVSCLGCCSLAPVMMVDGEAHGRLDGRAAVRVLEEIRAAEEDA